MDTSIEKKIFVVDDEEFWRDSLKTILENYSKCEIKLLKSFAEAEKFITNNKEILIYDAAIIDVKLEKRAYESGGLTLLDLLRREHQQIPVVVLTGYPSDYPGIREVIDRYQNVFVFDKETFEENSTEILDKLFMKLPPQIGDPEYHPAQVLTHSSPQKNSTSPWKSIILGITIILIILAFVFVFFPFLDSYPKYSDLLKIVFSIVMVVIIAMLLKVFTSGTIEKAVDIFKKFT